ncbi:hypothetical protein CLV38_11827 [Alkalibacterium olivapovliticus]|uniref:Uncharacterized protein n=1 Tax=Alkalibacterium olivapovliticus TaxID=99907 RepID=A0A2T0W5L4_9LACT|nr:hypothetical protein CLV38_11827 [Alkalibacterium olivapovliticus]
MTSLYVVLSEKLMTSGTYAPQYVGFKQNVFRLTSKLEVKPDNTASVSNDEGTFSIEKG